ncbi:MULTISPECIES: chorismate mutase [unclassified Pseudomonas]|uniref:chorismate mutase n=1 Tax=unclassified Pseudomonas TaxID=196821 RepID=UPI00244773E6|nr:MULTISPECIES: chorismate mutase [unclassified Pseudomonas]MDH0304191.1 prephenate dehydrogenase/arogenate dehydrogenase family protein [Pseudomonas sp. GD04091]MDH1986206.1 prephenate dehydrogenase/arogenate dehydrogenase family protein [Pseudomonas sp. GD03689]
MSLPSRPDNGQAIVIGAAGSIGRMLCEQLSATGLKVLGVDLVPAQVPVSQGYETLQDDICAPSAQLCQRLANANLLVLAISEKVLLQALPALIPHLALECLLVETLSIKSAFATLIRDVSLPQAVAGLNPMFSGDLSPEGRPVVVVPYQAGVQLDDLRERLASRGMRLFTLSAQEHDQTMALLQTVGHSMVLAFGHSLAASGVPLAQLIELAPPPFKVMLCLLARMMTNHPDVYWEIQAANPASEAARETAIAHLQRLDGHARSDAHVEFLAAMASLRNHLEEVQPQLAATCRQLFEVVEGHAPRPSGNGVALGSHRERIDRIDDQLIDLLAQRLDIIREVAHSKKDSNTAVMQPERVRQVVGRCTARGHTRNVPAALIEQLYHAIIEQSCQIEYDVIGGPRQTLLAVTPEVFSQTGVR